MYDILAFFEARLGRLYGFRWKDWADYKSVAPGVETSATDQVLELTNPDEASYQLAKSYTSGPTVYTRKIHKPVQSTVKLALDGVTLVEGTDFYVDYTSGLVYIGIIGYTGLVTAGFEFDVPVRFAQDHLDVTVELFNVGQAPQINTIEIKTGLGVANHDNYLLAVLNWLASTGVDPDTVVLYQGNFVTYSSLIVVYEDQI
jgi:uncharacterized protein (TIGR02217 family)